MPRFYPLKIQAIRKETEDCVSLTFDVPEALQKEFAFKPGQHLTLRTFINGEDVRRSYSICSSPREGRLQVAVKKLFGGQFSSFANEKLQADDVLDVMPPMGSFTTELNPTHQKHYVAFAAGSGITPVISILKAVLQTEPNSHFSIFYGNRSARSIIFKEEIEGLKNQYMDRLSIYYFLSQEDPGSQLFHGRITAEKCEQVFIKLLDVSQIDEFFICGPGPMIEAVQDSLAHQGVEKRKIHFELFTSPETQSKADTPRWTPPSQPVVSKITITLDGKTFSFNHTSSGRPILEAAQITGADLPYSCKGGVCCTCKAKILKGEVAMEVNYGLDPEEVQAGYILTCQAHPVTDEVVLSFDQ